MELERRLLEEFFDREPTLKTIKCRLCKFRSHTTSSDNPIAHLVLQHYAEFNSFMQVYNRRFEERLPRLFPSHLGFDC